MSFDAERLYELLPAVYRVRDDEEGLPLEAVLSVIAKQVAVVEEDLAQLYDDQFIETCAEWVVPYIGDLVGARGVYDVKGAVTQRAQVANTLRYRRRKGTAAVLEQVARDVTGWSAHAVEFFQVLATTQHMNHIRPNNLSSPDLRRWEPLERANTPFDPLSRIAEVRRIASRRGRYNIPNVGVFLWRLGAYSLTKSPAYKLASGASDRRYRFSPLGNDSPLYNLPETETDIAQLASPLNVPAPISRRALDNYLDQYYGKSLQLFEGANEEPIPAGRITVCDLSGWVRKPQTKYAVDPVLGRIASPGDEDPPSDLRVTYNYGFSADMGGGEYGRALSPYPAEQSVETVPSEPSGTIQQALGAVSDGGFVEITDSARYQEPLNIHVAAEDEGVEIRARDGCRPSIVLKDVLNISGAENTHVVLDGLLISGATLHVAAGSGLHRLLLRHCTLVPGLSIHEDGTPRAPSTASLTVEATNTSVEIDRCVVGGLRVADGNHVRITNSIVDATAESRIAYAALDDEGSGGTLHVENSTIIGRVHTALMEMASNTIFLAGLAEGDTRAPVHCERLQQGCVRFSYLPLASRAPRRHRCRPEDAAEAGGVRPQFSSLRYGASGYCQLSPLCGAEIRRGADDEAEMGAFHDLYQPQRETNLRVRLEEYLRFGLEAGVFYAS